MLVNAGIFSTNLTAWRWLKKWTEQGEIICHEIGLRTFFYTVPGEVKVTKPAGKTEPVSEPDTPEVDKTAGTKQTAVNDLEQLAARFGWEHPLFNNNLREFVKWYNLTKS
jgi:hypothetical protein